MVKIWFDNVTLSLWQQLYHNGHQHEKICHQDVQLSLIKMGHTTKNSKKIWIYQARVIKLLHIYMCIAKGGSATDRKLHPYTGLRFCKFELTIIKVL